MKQLSSIFVGISLVSCVSCFMVKPAAYQYNRYDKNGLMTGWWINKDDTAYIQVVKYKKGFREGKSRKLFSNGTYAICHYKHGRLNGVEKLYSGEGDLTQTILFKNDSVIKQSIIKTTHINWNKYRIM